MEERMIEKKQVHKIVKKKVYTPPTLIVYGKLTELTAGGLGSGSEPHNGNNPSPLDRRP